MLVYWICHPHARDLELTRRNERTLCRWTVLSSSGCGRDPTRSGRTIRRTPRPLTEPRPASEKRNRITSWTCKRIGIFTDLWMFILPKNGADPDPSSREDGSKWGMLAREQHPWRWRELIWYWNIWFANWLCYHSTGFDLQMSIPPHHKMERISTQMWIQFNESTDPRSCQRKKPTRALTPQNVDTTAVGVWPQPVQLDRTCADGVHMIHMCSQVFILVILLWVSQRPGYFLLDVNEQQPQDWPGFGLFRVLLLKIESFTWRTWRTIILPSFGQHPERCLMVGVARIGFMGMTHCFVKMNRARPIWPCGHHYASCHHVSITLAIWIILDPQFFQSWLVKPPWIPMNLRGFGPIFNVCGRTSRIAWPFWKVLAS